LDDGDRRTQLLARIKLLLELVPQCRKARVGFAVNHGTRSGVNIGHIGAPSIHGNV
jgi:hypothetical protein